MPTNYEKAEKEQIDKNYKNFNPDNIQVKEKIKKHCKRHGLIEKEIFDRIEKKDKYIISFFIKNPTKQNIYEKECLRVLQNMSKFKEVKKLSPSGKKSYYVKNGILSRGENTSKTKQETGKSKSIDFHAITKDKKKEFFILHKYTKESGGAQDNQCTDVRIFLQNAPSNRTNEYYVALLDGKYWENKIPELRKEFSTNKKLLIMTTNEFEKLQE